jgi:integrase
MTSKTKAAIRSDKQCENARVPVGKSQATIRIEGTPGLYFRVTNKGAKTWTLVYRAMPEPVDVAPAVVAKPVQRWLTIGVYPTCGLAEARVRASEAQDRVARGLDPSEALALQGTAKTFGDLFDYWYAKHAVPKLARPVEEQRRYDLHIAPALASIVASELKRQDVARLRDAVAAPKEGEVKGPGVQANRCIALVNRVLNFAVEEDLLEYNPAQRLRKATDEKPKERVLSDEELATLWHELDRCERWHADYDNDPARHGEDTDGAKGRRLPVSTVRAIRLLILTGARRAEVAGITPAELSLDGRAVWTLPGARSKNGEPHRVPLATMALFEVRRASAEAGDTASHLFPGDDAGHMRADSLTQALARLSSRLKLPKFGPHDLRRTVGTGLAKLRVPQEHRSLVLNHVRGKSASETTRVYDRHGYDDEKLEALTKWEAHVRLVVMGAGANIAALPSRA